jgi:hypothetical protein
LKLPLPHRAATDAVAVAVADAVAVESAVAVAVAVDSAFDSAFDVNPVDGDASPVPETEKEASAV